MSFLYAYYERILLLLICTTRTYIFFRFYLGILYEGLGETFKQKYIHVCPPQLLRNVLERIQRE